MRDCENETTQLSINFLKKVKGVHTYSTRCATANKFCISNRYNTITNGSTMFKIYRNYGIIFIISNIYKLAFRDQNLGKI